MADEEWPTVDPSDVLDSWSEVEVDRRTDSDHENYPEPVEGNHAPPEYQCAEFPLVTSNILARYGPSRSSTPTSMDRASLDMLSPELIHIVGKWFCISSFNPGRLYPQQVPDERGGFSTADGHRVLPPNPKAFEALNSRLYHEYRQSLWSESTWVIGEGSPFYSTDFLLDIPATIYHDIRSVELKFTLRDLGLSLGQSADDQGSTYVIDEGPTGHTNYNETSNDDANNDDANNDDANNNDANNDDADSQWNNINSSAEDNTSLTTDLTTMWWDKFYAVSSLNLTHLRLDFTDAYGPEGNFLGDDLARTLVPFSHGIPANLEIIATDSDAEDRLRNIVVARNQ